MQGTKTLQSALEAFFATEKLAGANQYECETCGGKQDAERNIVLEELPEVLCLQLLRFYHDPKTYSKKKLLSPITFPSLLDLSPFMPGSPPEHTKYRLDAVLIHQGNSASVGHYVAQVSPAAMPSVGHGC